MANTFKNGGGAVNLADTDLYTTPVSTASVIHAAYFTNTNGANDVTVNIKVYDSSLATERWLGKNVPIPAGDTLILDKPINLETGDIIRASSSADGDVDCFMSILEVT